MEKKQYLLFAVIILTAVLIRLWLAPMRGHVHDIEQLKIWTQTAVLNNPLAIYNDSTANYPPLGLLPLIIIGHIYRLFFSPEFDIASTTLTALIKLPAIIADLGTSVLLFCYLNKNHNLRWAFIGMAAYAFNPAVIYDSAWWGQLESLVTLPMLLSIMALGDGRIRWSWLWLVTAVLVKPQAAIIAPVVLLGSLQKGNWRPLLEGILAGTLFGMVVLLPLILVGQLPTLIAQIQASAGRQLFMTMNAHNLWFLATLGQGSFAAREASPTLDTQPLLGPLTGWHIGLFIFLTWTTLILFKQQLINRKLSTAHYPLPTFFYPAVGLVLGFYMLPAEAHERYLFPVLALLVPLLPGRRPFQALYLLFSLTLFFNLFWVDSAVPVPSFTQNLRWGVLISAVNATLMIIYLFLQPLTPIPKIITTK